MVRSNGSVEMVPVYGYRTDEIGTDQSGGVLLWRGVRVARRALVPPVRGGGSDGGAQLNVDGVAGFAADGYGGTVFVLLEDESALHADQC